jgi:hypothetical protein
MLADGNGSPSEAHTSQKMISTSYRLPSVSFFITILSSGELVPISGSVLTSFEGLNAL